MNRPALLPRALHPLARRRPATVTRALARHGLAGALLLALSTSACNRSADVDAAATQGSALGASADGRSLTLKLPGDVEPSTIQEIASFVEASTGAKSVSVRVEKRPEADTQVHLELFGGNRGDVLPALRAKFPALAAVEIEETQISGVKPEEAHPELAALETGSVEEVEQHVREKLAAEGHTGPVDVQISEENGRRKVLVRAKKEAASAP